MFAYIPARGGSKRIPRKNLKLLGEKPIIAHVIETVKTLDFITRVCVSTDDKDIQSVANYYGAETKDLRSKKLADDFVDFIALIREDLFRFAEDSEDVLFVLPTAALLKKEHYIEAFNIYRSDCPQVLMSVVEYNVSPLWAMKHDNDGCLKPLFPEAIKIRSQDLPKTCVDAGLFYIMRWKEVQKYETLIVDRLIGYNVSSDIAVDVDTLSDWERLEERYHRHNIT